MTIVSLFILMNTLLGLGFVLTLNNYFWVFRQKHPRDVKIIAVFMLFIIFCDLTYIDEIITNFINILPLPQPIKTDTPTLLTSVPELLRNFDSIMCSFQFI
jgi:hypothetical protein